MKTLPDIVESQIRGEIMKTRLLALWPALMLSLFAHAAPSPFDDLNSEEVKNVISVIKNSGRFSPEIRFPVIKRREPKKSDWLAGKVTDDRVAYAAVFEPSKGLLVDVMVDIKNKKILSFKELPGIAPPVLLEEYERARSLILADKRWQEALKKRGINKKDVYVDIWAPGLMSAAEQRPGQRILRGLTYMKKNARNFYARPIEGLVVTVDLAHKKVHSFWDLEKTPVAEGFRDLNEAANQPIEPKLKPLRIQNPDGNNIKIDGQEITWHRWKFRYSMDPLQALQLFHVQFKDGSDYKMILYKMSLAEMVVPYGGSGKNWSFRNAFDVGEYGLGKTLHPLQLGKDVPENATLLDTVVPDDLGSEPVVFKGAAIYERDGGILWKHRNAENGDTDIRRARQLVLTFMTTVGNYDYGTNYVFDMDGSIHVEVMLTGILLARGTIWTQNPCRDGCLSLVEKNIIAPPHQHFFNFRMDFDVDGTKNVAAEMNVVAKPKGKSNPDGNIFNPEYTILKTEKSARRGHNLNSARMWKIYNPNSTNALAHPRGFGIVPEEKAVPYLDPTSQIRKRAGFIEHPIWFTVYKDEEMSGAAPFPTTAPAGLGLPQYIADNEKLENKDLVMWYTFGVTHIPRPEEWPIMNVHRTGFSLKPINFFSHNPAINLPE